MNDSTALCIIIISIFIGGLAIGHYYGRYEGMTALYTGEYTCKKINVGDGVLIREDIVCSPKTTP